MNERDAKLPCNDDWDETTPESVPSSQSNGSEFVKCDEPGEQAPLDFPNHQLPSYFPAVTARTSLFSAARIDRGLAEDAPSMKVELKGQNGYKLTAWGPRLNMHDKLVWETAVQIAMEQKQGMGTRFAVSLRDFARRMGWNGCSGDALRWVWMSLRRLYFVRLEFALPNGSKGGGSILSSAFEDENGNFLIRLNPDFCGPIFHKETQFLIKTTRRAMLTGQLARWLHDHYSTHRGFDPAEPPVAPSNAEVPTEMRIKLERLRQISGYSSDRKQFLVELRDALTEIVEKAPELIASFGIERIGKSSDNWILTVKRGREKPAYLMPELNRSEKALPPPAPAQKTSPRKGSRGSRSGVAL